MMKQSDEIKKGLECCITCAETLNCARECPYFMVDKCAEVATADALALIQRLEERCKHMNDLRDAAAGRALKMEERVRQLDAENIELLGAIDQLKDENAQLLTKCKQLEAERDAAVADIERMVQEPYDPCYCDYCKLTDEECIKSNCRGRNAFVWRGVQKEDDHA